MKTATDAVSAGASGSAGDEGRRGLLPGGAWQEPAADRVLNAKQNKEENEIIAAAGELGSVVVATNMAGRGTHISLPKESLAYGGLHVIGVE